MKYILALLLLSFALLTTGCGPAFSTDSCRASVMADAGTYDVTTAPDKSFTFIVRKKDGSVWIYKTMNANDSQVTERIPVFGPLALDTPKQN